MPSLLVNEGGNVRVEKLNKSTITIGRDAANDIHINSREVSRFHCQIQRLEEGHLVTDLNSRNGTIVNGSYVRGVFLEEGDMVQIGDICLIYKIDATDTDQLEQMDAHQFKVIEEEKLEELKIIAMEREHLLKLQQISIEIASYLNIDKLLKVVLQNVLDLTDADRGFVMLLDDKNRLKIRTEKNMSYKAASKHEKRAAKRLIEDVLKEKKIMSTKEKLPVGDGADIMKTSAAAVNTMIVIPLKSMAWKHQTQKNERRREVAPFARQFLGVIYLASRKQIEPFSSQDLDLIEAISHHVSLGITNAKLHEMATTDRLTRIYNRGYFETMLKDELKKARHTSTPMSVILTDIDHFKKFNDTHGHQIGDQVLADVAQIMKNSIREDDIAARYGGEEFVFILPKTNAEQAGIVAEKMRKAVESAVHTEKSLKVTISLGAAAYPENAGTMDQLVKRADVALYRSKKDGRNCWRIWEAKFEEQEDGEERSDKLAGILSGDQAKNYRNTELLLETIALLNSEADLDGLLEKLLDKIIEITNADRAIVFLADEYGILQFRKGRSNQRESLTQVTMYSQSIPKKVFDTGKSCCMIDDCTDSMGDEEFSPSMSMGRFQLKTVMCVPLKAQNTKIGVLYVDSLVAKQEFSDSDLVFLEAVTNQVALAIRHATVIEEKLTQEHQKRKHLERELARLRKKI